MARVQMARSCWRSCGSWHSCNRGFVAARCRPGRRLAARAGPVLATLRNRARRAAMEERLRTVTAAGYLGPMVQVLEDPAGRTDDAREAQEAVLGLHGIDAELARIATGSAQRAALAARIGQEVAAGFGLAALAAVLAVAAFG